MLMAKKMEMSGYQQLMGPYLRSLIGSISRSSWCASPGEWVLAFTKSQESFAFCGLWNNGGAAGAEGKQLWAG